MINLKYSIDVPSTHPFMVDLMAHAERNNAVTWIGPHKILCQVLYKKAQLLIIFPVSIEAEYLHIVANDKGVEYLSKIRKGEIK